MEIGKWNIPENPGVYLMKEKNKVIYVGKAKNLYKRVKSYFQKEVDREKTRELVKHIDDIEYILCPSELDALLLENNLIKKYNPKYNIALKDEKTYPYLSLSKETFPALHMIRKTKHLDLEHYEYFGPYPFGAWKLKKILLKLFKIRDCFWNMNKKYKRPCLKYDMKTCLGPCVHKEVREEYQQMIAKVREVLKGNTRECIQGLRSAMEEMAETFQFEKAIVLREQIQELLNLEKEQISEYGKEIDEDVFVWKEAYERMFLCVLNVREGKILGKISSNFLLEEKVYENLEEELLLSYYRKYPLPRSIVLEEKYQQVLEEGISHLEMLFKKKIERYFPKIKSRRGELLDMALLNLEKDIENFHLKREVIEEGMKELHSFLGLKRFPRRIECFDISNIQGKDAVASMSVSIEGKAAKGEYRKFKIQCKDTPDDFAMMREVIYRRYSKLEAKDFPDVILIDGGLGQINSAGAVLEELGKIQFTDLLSLAKRDEEVYKYGEGLPYSIPKDKEALKIFQRVRDEAHRFGITYHRKLRSKRIISSELDTIEGIGEVRKKKLLKKFSSIAGVKAATLEELEECVPKNVAIRIKEELGG
ncbi:UvrABC system subunit C [Fusobacterium necrophorum BFTR-2]|nr:excinuclease ABC subunit UvrC [Fusobacterium necrophorum]KDE74014.1 UvrABC system subunit C [Fusobacterium necrophorum BFTR-2]